MADKGKLSKIIALLADEKAPMKARYRALFSLKNVGGKDAIDAISSNFSDRSSLLKHELAYCLGQMQDDRAVDVLKSVVRDEDQDVIVRHEAGNPTHLHKPFHYRCFHDNSTTTTIE